MRKASRIGAALLIVALAAGASAQPDVPALTGRVVDRADLLSAETEAALTARLQAHEDSTTNQIVVLTLPSLNGEVLEPYATTVFRTWGLGQAGRNNGVLVLIARDDRKIRLEVGYGLEGALPDATAAAIIRNEMTPRFRSGDFEGGTLAAVDAIIGSIQGEYVPADSASGDEMPWWGALLFGVFFSGIPGALAFRNLVAGPVARYVGLLFLGPFIAMGAMVVLEPFVGGGVVRVALAVFAVYVVLFVVLDIVLSRTEWLQEKRRHYAKKMEAFKRARKSGRSVVYVDGVRYSVPTSSSSGGGFSGGGGSSGGGGASGGW
ncbi:MAG TPA: TPM domain-containing protein [Bacteroidetes bacterium]|nr:TPM domain-containing protein [Bacteroidota bacterium]